MANFLDRAIAYVAPRYAADRAAARAKINGLERATALYDGAAKSWRTASRRISSTSANTETMMSLGRLRDVSRDLRRNNALAHNAINVIAAHVVGAGIIPTIDGKNERTKKRLQPLIRAHLETTAIDFDGRHNLYGLQKLIIDTVAEAGEALIVRIKPQPSARLVVPLQVRVLEPDYLNSLLNGPTSDGGHIFQGIELDKDGRRVAYHMFKEHPGGGVTWQMPPTIRVPADDVLHVYRVERPGQLRGVPWCAPVVMTLWDLADYEDAELVRQKIAACFAVFLEGATPTTNLAQQNANLTTRAGTVIDRLEPGLIQKLPDGVKATFASPPITTGFNDFIKSRGHKIAAGYGVPYELISTDNSDVSFISGRLGLMQFHRVVDQWRWHMMIPHACDGIGNWFLEAAGIVSGPTTGVTLKHTPPRRELIEPSKEIPAIRDAIRSGLTSRSEELRSLGYDPEMIDDENADDNKRADKLKLGYDSDGRRAQPFTGPPDNTNDNTNGNGDGGKKPAAQ